MVRQIFQRICSLVILTAMLGGLFGPGPARPASAETTSGPADEWRVDDDGAFVTAENPVLKLRFAYNARRQQGWFLGSGNGGGGNDGAIVELYHKPTSPTANLVFRNGTWGSGYDALDMWEADNTATDWETHAEADFQSNRHGKVLTKLVRQSAGRLLVDFEVDFVAWRLNRHYIVYPSGQITISTDVYVVKEGMYNYLAHRFNFAGSQYQVVNGETFAWGGDYQNQGGRYQSWTDGVNRLTGQPVRDSATHALVDQAIRANAQVNTGAHSETGRDDSYSGFLIKGNGVSPAVMVIQGAKNDWEGPFSAIARKVGQDPRSLSTDYRSYVETALFSFNWAPNNLTQVGTTWFYMTTPGQSPDGNVWNKRGYWAKDLGTWNETFHVVIDPSLQSDEYLARWAERARDLGKQTPTDLVGATDATLGQHDQLYHVAAAPNVSEVGFSFQRATSDLTARPLNYRTTFVVENVGRPEAVLVNGVATALPVYYDAETGTALIIYDRPQSTAAERIAISLRVTPMTGQASPAPAPTPIPVLTPAPVAPSVPMQTRDAYAVGGETSTGANLREWKNSLFEVKTPMTLRRLGFAGGADNLWELHRSTSAGGWGELIAKGWLGTTSVDGFYVADVDNITLAPGFYTLHVHVNQGTYAYGTAPKIYDDIAFHKSSSGSVSVNASEGTFQIRLVYNR